MMIDDNEVPHSFCIGKSQINDSENIVNCVPEHSEQIAEKAKLWIDDILEN